MPDSIGSLVARTFAFAMTLAVPAAAAAQQMPLATPPPTEVEFLSRFDFMLAAAALRNVDERFSWDTHWAGDLDLIDYKSGRITFLADYQALLGNQLRPFDPYQSNYTLEAAGSVRAGATEFVLVLNHISRHLGDRPKPEAVAENSLGLRVLRHFEGNGNSLDVRVEMRKVIAQAYIDYTWMGEFDTTLRIRISPRTAIYGRIAGNGASVDSTIANRGGQYGGRAEVGVRLKGTGGVMELFGGTERMYDADPLDRLPQTWGFLGFRIKPR